MASRPESLIGYRIGDARHPLFDGRGAMLEGGRWNSPGLPVEAVTQQALPDWDHRNQCVSRAFGDAWINSQRSVALRVPSVIAPHDENLVINPLHPEFRGIIKTEPESIQWDDRLFKKRG